MSLPQDDLVWCYFSHLIAVYTLKAVEKNAQFLYYLNVVNAGPNIRSQIQSHWGKFWKTPEKKKKVLDFDNVIDKGNYSQIWELMKDCMDK